MALQSSNNIATFRISALYDTHQVAIRIDDQPFVVAYASSRNFGKLQTRSALFIGGLPGKYYV